MINKILDNYYRKQLQILIHDHLIKFRIDTRFINGDLGFHLDIKEKKYNDKEYFRLFNFSKEMYIFYLANIQELYQELDICVKKYFKGSDSNDIMD